MSDFSIGAAMDEYDRIAYEQRELEREDRPAPDSLAWSMVAHPPNECGDPSSCAQHAGDYWSYLTEHPHEWCEDCGHAVAAVDEFEDQIGFEEQAREVRVTALDCGHSIDRPLKGVWR